MNGGLVLESHDLTGTPQFPLVADYQMKNNFRQGWWGIQKRGLVSDDIAFRTVLVSNSLLIAVFRCAVGCQGLVRSASLNRVEV